MLTVSFNRSWLISESSGILNKRLDGSENSSIFISCQIFISKQKNIDV